MARKPQRAQVTLPQMVATWWSTLENLLRRGAPVEPGGILGESVAHKISAHVAAGGSL